MRKPTYLSPSALSLWKFDQEAYYLRYLSNVREVKEPQTAPMSVGSAFDAYIKAYLHNAIFGPNGKDSAKYELSAIFEAQVESQHRSAAWEAGAYLFGLYKDYGALAELMYDLQGAATEPRFEIEIQGVVRGQREGLTATTKGVTLLGKPDIIFINHVGAVVILDWKVNGYYSRSTTSPMPGYKRMFAPYHRNHGDCHPDYCPMQFKGMEVDSYAYLEARNPDWARQLSTYGWLLGEPVGTEIVTAIDQLVCAPGSVVKSTTGAYMPSVRIAQHRSRVSQQFQLAVFDDYANLWRVINEEPFWYFRDLTIEQSAGRCELLELQLQSVGDTELDQWLLNVSKKGNRFGR